ncbi:lipoprotein [Streptomyces mashuensis]|uniref:Lipoprotein n=1 Tax=Streptomyces mashuensis TaxID=33904 RepID=A0A919AV98_9ACTN|nr:hypothetical protein [Streptomyces mashuensis]GHF27763.1 lipoprotein [Streptomyces mashuensis]
MRRSLAAAAAVLALVAGAGAACSSSSSPSHPPASPSQTQKPSDVNPPGDIPDTQAFVPWSSPDGAFTVKVPEGWSRMSQGVATVFTDKFNSVRVEHVPAATAPTADSVRTRDLPAIQAGSRHFSLVSVTEVQRKGGKAVLAEYRADSAPDQVTGKSVPLDVQRFVFFSPAKGEAVLTLSGGVGADNADPWRTITDSFRWT